ncbi:S-layer homology domain-containing protein [Brachybacterium nesterenkovii]|uniref:S-layer homology domain-containing protein n=1 Tax=Brachybacterium nesterenkovii TaxID=47847 RepID=UPI003219EA56
MRRTIIPGPLARPVLVAGFATIALTGILLGASEARADESPVTTVSASDSAAAPAESAPVSGAAEPEKSAAAEDSAAASSSEAPAGGADAESTAPAAETSSSADSDASTSEDPSATGGTESDVTEPDATEPVTAASPAPGGTASEDDAPADPTTTTSTGADADADAEAEANPDAQVPTEPETTTEPVPTTASRDAATTEQTTDPSSTAAESGSASPAAPAEAAPSAEAPAATTGPAAADTPIIAPAATAALAATTVPAAETTAPAPTMSLRAVAAPAQVGFTDVPAGTRYYDQILWAQSQGIVTAEPDGTFRPTASTTRAEFLAMLYALRGPSTWTSPSTSPYTDVATTDRYYREITWAYGTGLDTGYADRTYRPTTAISHDAAMTLLYRLYRFEGAPGPARSPFIDVAPQSPSYTEMSWAYANGFVTVSSKGEFRPSRTITRGEMTAVLYRVVGGRPSRASVMLSGPTGSYWRTHNGGSAVGAPTGHAYRYGNGLRQDFADGSILYSPVTGGVTFVTGDQLAEYDARAGASTFGMVTSDRTHRGATAYQQFDNGGIYSTDGWTFTVTGTLYRRYLAAGGMGGYLNAPIGDVRTGSTGITYQSFKGGQLTTPDYWDSPPPTTPAGGAKYTYPTLSSGSTGDYVRAVQAKVGAPIDGRYGASTVAAVRAFQQAQGIPVTGTVDLRTWARIMSSPNRVFDGTNGRLAPEQLTIVAPNWTLPTDSARAFLAMQDTFRRDTGGTFTLNDAYRPFDRQVQLFVAYGAPRASVPGASNHGDATTGAIDISLERDDATYRWLLANAILFGFGQSAYQNSSEPWHWQHTY